MGAPGQCIPCGRAFNGFSKVTLVILSETNSASTVLAPLNELTFTGTLAMRKATRFKDGSILALSLTNFDEESRRPFLYSSSFSIMAKPDLSRCIKLYVI